MSNFEDYVGKMRALTGCHESTDRLPWERRALASCCFLDPFSSHVNELLIINESESQGGSLTDRVEELLKGE